VACYASPRRNVRTLTIAQPNATNYPASEAPDPGRHHVGIPSDIISECLGDFIEIRSPTVHSITLSTRTSLASGWRYRKTKRLEPRATPSGRVPGRALSRF
jgi:hypothetical protein